MPDPTPALRAYDAVRRVNTYDTDMDVMHPNRHHMVDVLLRVLPFERDEPLHVLDLGVGSGFLTERLLLAFPAASVVGVDGADAMLNAAWARLSPFGDRVALMLGDLRELDTLVSDRPSPNLVVSSFALHHLSAGEKLGAVRACTAALQPRGWFLNADTIVGNTPALETRYQTLRVNGIVERARDPRAASSTFAAFSEPTVVRTFLDRMERAEGDQPLTLDDDLAILRAAGLQDVTVFWLELREAVVGGVMP